MNTNTIFIKITKVPGGVTEVSLTSGSTVSNALEAAELSSDGYTITVNGSAAGTDTDLEDGDRIILAQAVKSAS